MIGYKCNVCGDKISEKKYQYLKEHGDLRCIECGKGIYESYFIDEDDTIGDKIKDITKSGDKLPGATGTNRMIGGVSGAIIGALIFGGWLSIVGLALGGFLGYSFAPYFVPKLRKLFKKIKDEISDSDK